MRRVLPALCVGAGALLFSGCDDPATPTRPADAAASTSAGTASRGGFEVWTVDQSNTSGVSYGGRILIHDGAMLMGDAAASATPQATLDLSGETSTLCRQSTGAFPVRPHMLLFNRAETHAVLSFVTSGHVVVFDAAARKPVSCIRTSAGAGGARQAHAAFPSPDDSYILVANQNGKLLERIDTDYAANRFVLNSAATLNLATCTTPNGLPCQSPALRPDNAPICPIVDGTGDYGFTTLRGGGMFVVDARSTPMRIVAEYDRSVVGANGCGGAEAAGSMYINSGGGTASHLHGFDVFRFPLTGYDPSHAPNLPAPQVLFSSDEHDRDGHGMVVSRDERYLWVFDRDANVAEVFDAATGAHTGTVALAGAVSDDPTPDLADISPSGSRIFVTLRGPNPLTGDPHVATGSTPGIGIVQVQEGGRTGTLKAVVPISNRDANGVERADPHGIRIRRR
ncbi:MAG TPA: hypothetical protein VGR37_06840 [Longimicrobiaceae bacterium]|nr:hypothetical protein [Longimicrobiaceae bacterium]